MNVGVGSVKYIAYSIIPGTIEYLIIGTIDETTDLRTFFILFIRGDFLGFLLITLSSVERLLSMTTVLTKN